jgi:hypothetical protein
MPSASSALSVFINCPFDKKYRPIFDAILFTVARCGFQPRCALESGDSGGTRIEKIMRLIEQCRYGIHDLSRTELDSTNRLPRFNMPFELGIFLGAKRFGTPQHRRKSCLVLDKERYRYQKFISDIAGQDIKSHDEDAGSVIAQVRNFLREESQEETLPGGKLITREYAEFEKQKPKISKELDLDPVELTFTDQAFIIAYWIKQKAATS